MKEAMHPARICVLGMLTFVASSTAAAQGSQVLPRRGDVVADWKIYDCRTFGSQFVLRGIKARVDGTLSRLDIYCAALASNGTLGTDIFLPGVGATDGGTTVDRKCSAGTVVSGYQGSFPTTGLPYIQSMRLRCKPIMADGLTGSSPAATISAAGTGVANGWGPDDCTLGRPARAIRISYVDVLLVTGRVRAIESVALICSQATPR